MVLVPNGRLTAVWGVQRASERALAMNRQLQAQKGGSKRALSISNSVVSARRLVAMNARAPTQASDSPSALTYQYLVSRYGPLLTLKHLAEVLHSTPNGLRMTLARRRDPLSVALSRSRRRLGRRVYFDAALVGKAIAEAGGGPSDGQPPSSETEGAGKVSGGARAERPT